MLVPPQELLLPGPGQELPDQPVRRPPDPRRPPRRRGGARGRGDRDAAGRHRAPPHGGGHRQVAARRGHGSAPRRRPIADRLQPLRYPAAGDRLPPRYPRPGDRPGLPARAAGDRSCGGCLGCPHGPGFDPVRRERLGASGGRAARDPDRDQEPQLGALARPRGALRGAPAGRGARGRRDDPDGDPPLGRGSGGHRDAPGQGIGDRLPLLPGPRPGRRHLAARARGDGPVTAARAAGRHPRAVAGGRGAAGAGDRAGRHRRTGGVRRRRGARGRCGRGGQLAGR